MKNLLMILLFLTLSYSISKADCVPTCEDEPWTHDTVTITVPGTTCWIHIEYEHRTVKCDGAGFYEVRIIKMMAWLDASCNPLDAFLETYEAGVTLLLTSGILPFPLPTSIGECRFNIQISGPACWEKVYKPFHPIYPGYWFESCQAAPTCCRPYKICREPDMSLKVTPLPYYSLNCNAVIGPQTHKVCEPLCP